MKDEQYKAHRRILIIDGDVKLDETAMWFAESSLASLESHVAKLKLYDNLEKGGNVGNNSGKACRLLHILRFQMANFKRKFFKFLFKHLFLSHKTPTADHIVCLYIKYDVDVTADTVVFGGAESHTAELIKNTRNRFFGRI